MSAAGRRAGSDHAGRLQQRARQRQQGSTATSGDADVTPVADHNAPYDETVTLTSFFEIAAPIMNTFDESQLDEYLVLKEMKEATNIDIDYLWYAADTEEDAETKKNTAIASGEIPDFMVVNAAQLALLAKTDLINKDMGTIYEQYGSDLLKQWTTAQGEAALGAATYDGKVIAIPLVDSSIDTAPLLWIRKDWLDNLNLQVPTTLDELYEVMTAFKNNDPDGDGANDTVGIAMHKNFLSAGTGDAAGLFHGFGSYPLYWVEDGNGGLVHGSTTQASRDALEFLAKAFADGLIQEDFSVKDDAGTTELTASGTAGMQYGLMWNAMWPLSMTVDNDPECDWVAVPIPGIDGIGTPGVALRVTGFAVVSAECEHPEAVIKLLNFWCDAFAGVRETPYEDYYVDYSGAMQFPQHHFMLKTWNPTKNLDCYYHIREALDSGDTSKLAANYADMTAWMDGDVAQYAQYRIFGPTGSSFEAIAQYYENDMIFMNKFTGAQTPTMSKNMSIIEDKIYEYYTKVIMGVESLDNFDAFVEDLNSLGLTQITAEVNEWYAAQ